jgi:Na+-transporting NADH:ubiquinone oxidoreductase subunit NqrC
MVLYKAILIVLYSNGLWSNAYSLVALESDDYDAGTFSSSA